MKTLYHAAGPNYQPGEDLLSLQEMQDLGWIEDAELRTLCARWELGEGEEAIGAYLAGDGSLVSFTTCLEEARWIRDEHNGCHGLILAVDLEALKADGVRIHKNAEGYPSVYTRVEACYLTVVEEKGIL